MRGSVYKRCQEHGVTGTKSKRACRKPHGSWYYRVDVDAGSSERRQPSKGGFRTQTAAEEALAKVLAQGGAVDDAQLTVEQWLRRWLAENEWKPRTRESYTRHVEQVLIPQLGKKRLRDLRRRDVDKMLRDVATVEMPEAEETPERVRCGQPRENRSSTPSKQRENGQPCRKWAVEGDTRCEQHGGVRRPVERTAAPRVEKRAAGTLDSYRRTLRTALAAAHRLELIASNPAQGQIDAIPKRGKPNTPKPWTPEQVAQFLAHVRDDDDVALFLLAAFAGMRRGELLGLPWSALELDGSSAGVDINDTVVDSTGPQACPRCDDKHTGRLLQLSPKSEASVRWVPVVPGTVKALRQHKERQDEVSARRAERGAWVDHGLAFPDPFGAPRRPEALSKRFVELAAQVELPPIRLHDMRDGACSLLLAGGMPIEIVAMILGHANPAVTRRAYAHVIRSEASEGMRRAVKLVWPEVQGDDEPEA